MIDLPGFTFRKSRYGDMAAFPDRFVKAKEVFIAWNLDQQGRVTEVLLTDDLELWRREERRFEMTGGACYADWCVPPSKRVNYGWAPDQLFDPIGAFATLLSWGFANRRVLLSGLVQFAAIDTCFWARRMLFALAGEWSENDLDKPA